MVRRFLLALMLLSLFAQPSTAQTFGGFNVPSDIPSPYYSAVTPLYKTDSSDNFPIDSTVTPPTQTGLTNVPIPSSTGRITTNSAYDGTISPYCLTIMDGGTCSQRKFRTHADFQAMLPDDPIRNARSPGTSHLHCFFGMVANAYSTYKTLRNHALDSAAVGTDVNGTGYWFPCMTVLNPYGDGKNYAIALNYAVVYYVLDGSANAFRTGYDRATYIPVGLRYVLSFDMDSASPAFGTGGQYAWLQTALDTANTAYGSTRYTLTNAGVGYTQVVYNCVGATPSTATVIKTSAGGDPHAGTCGAGQDYFAQLTGPSCWDGVNLWSPGGYKHVIPKIWDTLKSKWVCPYNYYQLPELNVQFHWTQNGWTDRQRWDLSSDISYRAAHGLNSTQVPPGTTFHTDWMFGWDNVQMRKWEANCIGVENNTSHECDSSQISSTEQMVGAPPAAGMFRTPQVDTSSLPHTLQADSGWLLIPPAWSGSLTAMHIHH